MYSYTVNETLHGAQAAIPCPHCGSELYDRATKFKTLDGGWSKGTWCPSCWNCINNKCSDEEIAEMERLREVERPDGHEHDGREDVAQ